MYSSFTFFSVEHIPKEAAAKFLFLYTQAVDIDSAENIHQIDNEIQKKFQNLTEEKLSVSDLWQVFRETSEGGKMRNLMHPCKSERKYLKKT